MARCLGRRLSSHQTTQTGRFVPISSGTLSISAITVEFSEFFGTNTLPLRRYVVADASCEDALNCHHQKEKQRKVYAFHHSIWEPPKAAAWSCDHMLGYGLCHSPVPLTSLDRAEIQLFTVIITTILFSVTKHLLASVDTYRQEIAVCSFADQPFPVGLCQLMQQVLGK